MRKRDAKIMYNYVTKQHKNTYWFEKFGANFFYYYLILRKFVTRKSTILHFMYVTNTQCTLRCKECHTYIPYYKNNMHYMTNFERFKTEIDKLLKSVDIILSFRIQGGESLLVKDLDKIVKYACSKKQIKHIQIITNGTIIPSQELLNSMKSTKLFLSISDYSNNKELAGKLKHNKIIELCNKNNVHCKYWINDSDDVWFAATKINNDKELDKDLAIRNRDACHCNCNPKSILYSEGKLYFCPEVIYYNKIIPNFHFPEDEIVDVMNTPKKLLAKKIIKFENKKYYLLCSKCNASEVVNETYPPGEQLKGSAFDKTIYNTNVIHLYEKN